MVIVRISQEIGATPREAAQRLYWREVLGYMRFWERQRPRDQRNIMEMDGAAMATALTGGS